MGKNGTAYVNLDEQETTIQFNRIEDVAHICTSDSTMKTKFNKMCKESPNHWKLIEEDEVFSFYECRPKSLISYRSKVTERNLTDEQREAMAQRLREARYKSSQDSQVL
jgi:hypothetical protein